MILVFMRIPLSFVWLGGLVYIYIIECRNCNCQILRMHFLQTQGQKTDLLPNRFTGLAVTLGPEKVSQRQV
jgi:hypothetical protein